MNYIAITPQRENRFFNKNGDIRQTKEVRDWVEKNATKRGETLAGEMEWEGTIGIVGPSKKGVLTMRKSVSKPTELKFSDEYHPDEIFAAEIRSR